MQATYYTMLYRYKIMSDHSSYTDDILFKKNYI